MSSHNIKTQELQDLSKQRELKTPSKKKSLLQAYKDALNRKKQAQAAKQAAETQKQNISIPTTDSVTISKQNEQGKQAPKKAAVVTKKAKVGDKPKAPSRVNTMIAIKKLVARAAEAYYNIDSPLTFNHLNLEVEQLIDKLINDMGIKTEKVMDAKIEGKNISTAKIFESLAVMIAVEKLIAGGRRNKKARRSFETKTNDLRKKLSLLGFDLAEDHLTESALTFGEDFLSLLQDKLNDVNLRLDYIKQIEGLVQEGSLI